MNGCGRGTDSSSPPARPAALIADVEARLAASGLPAAVRDTLREVARQSELPAAARLDLLDELVDHFRSGLELGIDEQTLLRRFGPLRRLRPARPPFGEPEVDLRRGDGARSPGMLRRTFAGLGADVRSATRSLARSPAFALGNVTTLALGVGAAVALFALLAGVLLRPLPYAEPDRLFYLYEKAADGRRLYPSYPNFDDWRAQSDLFAGVISVTWEGTATVLGADQPVRARGIGVSRDFFEVLGVRPLRGRTFLPEENVIGGPPLAVVSEEFWRMHLGAREGLAAAPLQIGAESFTVIGVLPRGFRFLEPIDIYVPHERHPGTVRSAHAYQVVARLAPGVDAQEAQRQLDLVTARIELEHGDDNEAVATDWLPLEEKIVGRFGGVVSALFAASLLVLLVASTDVAAALLARGERRATEIAVRQSLGASRLRLGRQLLVEALLLTGPAFVLGLLLARAGLAFLRRFGEGQVPRLEDVRLDGTALLAAAGLSLVATTLCALLPMRQSLRARAATLLRAGSARGRGRLATGALVAGQAAIAFVLLAGAALLVRSLERVLSADHGFETGGIAAVHLDLPSSLYPDPAARAIFTARVREELDALPGVERTALANLLPFDRGAWSAPVVAEEQPDEWLAIAGWRLVTPDYFDVLAVPLVAGGGLPPDGLADGGATAVVINESVARKLAPLDPAAAVGRRIRSNFDPRFEWLTVVGVVAEARHWQAEAGTQPEVFVHYATRPEGFGSQIVLLETRSSPRALFRSVEQRLRELDRNVPIRVVALTDALAETLRRERLTMAVLGVFALVVLALALAGVAGVVSRAVALRRREVGIRLALGATPASLVRLLQAEALLPAAAGALLGAAVALAASRALESLLHDVSPADAPTYVAVAAMLGGAAFLASLVPARRALADDPASSIRRE